MVVEIIFFIVFMILYFYVYVELKVNKYNQIYYFDKEITREHIYKESLIKLPFFFNGKHINLKQFISQNIMHCLLKEAFLCVC